MEKSIEHSRLELSSAVKSSAHVHLQDSGLTLRKFLAFFTSGFLITSLLSAGVVPSLASENCAQTVSGTLIYESVQIGNECVVTFTAGSGNWTPPAGVEVLSDLLVVGGGGGGGQAKTSSIGPGFGQGTHGGGGGGGGGVTARSAISVIGEILVTVGAGGASTDSAGGTGARGENSVFGSHQAGGGGGGGGVAGSASATCASSLADRNQSMVGGSPNGAGGGGAGSGYDKCGAPGPASYWGNSGNNGAGGGGGGLGGRRNQDQAKLRPGEPGVTLSITGEHVTYAAGAAGAAIGQTSNVTNTTPGGGGAGSASFSEGLKAHSGNPGLVVIRYALPFFEVTFNAQGGSSVVAQQTLLVASSPGSTLIDFEFQGWFDSPSGGDEISFPYSPNANVTLHAQWLPIYDVTFDAQGGSTPSAQSVGKVLSAPSTSRDNFELQGWFDSPSGGNQITFSYQPPSDITLYAQWLPIFTVTFDSQGGSSIDSLVASSVSEAPETSRAAFQLDGFFDSPSGGTEIQFPFRPSADTTIFAQWIPLYVVTFDSQGGGTVDTAELEVVASSPSVSRAGFEFQGWFDSASGGSEVTFPYSLPSNVTLYAQWLPILEVSFDAQGGTTPDIQNVARVLSSPSTIRSNFEFQGWFDAATGGNEISFAYQPPSDITLYAQWLPIYTVTFNSHRGSSVQPQSTAGSISSPIPTRYAYKFNGWFTSRNGGEQIGFPYTPTSNLTLHAQWTHGSVAGMDQSRLPVPAQMAMDGTRKTFDNAIRPGVSSRIEIPAGALPADTTVEVYTITDTDFVSSAISNSYRFLVTQIISWTDSNGDVAIATEPIVMTVTDPSIVAGSRIYSVMNEVVTQIGVATQDGEAVVTFSEDPLITVAITSPDAPTSITVNSATQTSVKLSWLAPAVDGGDAITGYTVTANTGENCTTATLTCTITGLSASTTYSFTVQATNSTGTSPVSSSVSYATLGVTPGLQVVSEPSLIYSGPLIDSTQKVHQGSEVVFTGRRLESVRAAYIGGDEVPITSVSSRSLGLIAGSSIKVGTYDLVLESSLGTVTFQDGVIVLASFDAASSKSSAVEARFKKLTVAASKGFIAIYTKGYDGQKLSAKVAGKWLVVNPIDESSESKGYGRSVRRTGSGRVIKIHVFIDGVFLRTEEVTTK